MTALSKNNPLKHYRWGNGCDGWVLCDNDQLSVKLESMPPHTAEKKHLHQHTQQFFFIMQGTAVFEINEQRFIVKANEGIHIQKMQPHRILNENGEALEFLLSSQPAVGNDRVDC